MNTEDSVTTRLSLSSGVTLLGRGQRGGISVHIPEMSRPEVGPSRPPHPRQPHSPSRPAEATALPSRMSYEPLPLGMSYQASLFFC